MLWVIEEAHVSSWRLERIHWQFLVHHSALAACVVLTMLSQLEIAADNPASSSRENLSQVEHIKSSLFQCGSTNGLNHYALHACKRDGGFSPG